MMYNEGTFSKHRCFWFSNVRYSDLDYTIKYKLVLYAQNMPFCLLSVKRWKFPKMIQSQYQPQKAFVCYTLSQRANSKVKVVEMGRKGEMYNMGRGKGG